MTIIFIDTFTEASANVELNSHTPDTGTGWTRVFQDGANPLLQAEFTPGTCGATTQNNSACAYTADETYPSADYEVEWTIVNANGFSTRPYYVFVRYQDNSNMYAVRGTETASGYRLYTKVGGTWTPVGSAVTIADGSVCILQIIGTALKLFDDGVEVASATVSDISAAGKAGLASGGGGWGTDSGDDSNSALEIDDFSVTDLGGGGGLTGTINQSSETDTAQPMGKAKHKAVAQPSETDSAQAFTRVKQLAVAQASETDAAQSFSASKVRALGQASESDAAQAFTARKVKSIGQVSESDEAQALSASKVQVLGQASESDEAQALTSRKVLEIGQASEIDSAQPVSSSAATMINQVEETDLAQPFTVQKIKSIGQASESNEAQALTRVKVLAISQVSETDLAQALFPQKRLFIAQVLEVDLAQALSGRKVKVIGQASEIDAALAIDVGGTEFHRNRQLQPMFTSMSPLGS